jgi:hypothetical protein
MKHTDFASNWQEIASGFRKRGITAYGGPAIMGLMHPGLGGAGIGSLRRQASCRRSSLWLVR